MVIICEIRFIKSFCCMILDNGEKYWLHRDDLYAVGFQEGKEYELDFFMQQIIFYQYPHALNHAVSMLSRRSYSKKEISDRLTQYKFTKEVIELVLYKLEKEKLVNDFEFCDQWIRFRLSRRLGPSAIRRELLLKGISESIIDDYLDRIDPDEEKDNAVAIASKAWNRLGCQGDIRKTRQKVIMSLVRKGYDWETARSACDHAERIKKIKLPE